MDTNFLVGEHINSDDRIRTGRQSLLPIFPSSLTHTMEDSLLLANIPEYQLNPAQYQVRSQYGFHERTSTRPPTTDHARRLAFLSRRWNINDSILESNLTRLMKFAKLFGANRIHRFSIPRSQAYLQENEYATALEFFLQIDINLFYMKTCSYRGAKPIQFDETHHNTIFCINEPQPCYDMMRCHRTSCCLCYPRYKLTDRYQRSPFVQFGSNQQHRFINTYRSILNCPATCQTENIIYVLTCPCHRVDYIGETKLSLASRLSFHQKHGNRIMQEFLLGPKNVSRITCQTIKSTETLVKDGMALYQHSTQCSSAIQLFLEENPEYWPFIPQENQGATTTSTIGIDSNRVGDDKDNAMFSCYVRDLPSPPVNYQFTYEQKIEIDRFFHEKKYLNSPNPHLDLYQAAIVAILPLNTSDALRRFIEALFITHTEAQLNNDGHLDQLLFPNDGIIINQAGSSPVKRQQHQNDQPWCKHLASRSRR